MKAFYVFAMALSLAVAGCMPSAYSQATSTTEEAFSPIVLPALPDELDFAGERVPLEYFDVREALQREQLVTGYLHSRTFLTLLAMDRYFSIIEPILRRNGIPEDFKYLCMAESGLNPEAVSPSGAGGLWQFMPATGREYGLKVGNQVDERFHIEKSTEAACRYLKKAYEKLGSWTLAAATYNAGENGVVRRTGIQGTDSYYDTFLPQETMRYVYRILSLKLIASDPAAYGYRYRPEDRYPRLDDCREVAVGGRDISWSEVARRYGTNYKMLRLLNPWIRAYEYDNPGNETLQVKMPGQHFRTR